LEKTMNRFPATLLLAGVVAAAGCGSNSDAGGEGPHTRPGAAHGGMPAASAQPTASTAVPVQTTRVARRDISQHLETNGVLEAENEVDIVARVSGPIAAIEVEEGMEIRKDQLLVRIDDREYANQAAIAVVSRDDAQRALERTRASWNEGLVSQESYDSALSRLESAEAQLEAKQILLDYTQVRAPFSGKVAARYIKLAQHVGIGTPLFRISDFNPLLCPIQVPEKDLPKLHVGQPAHLRVEPFPDERFNARVQRIRPTVESATGTVTVTLEVGGRDLLRPGMFASVYLETDVHHNALVIPASALVLDSIGDTVFLRQGDSAVRREVRLGFREADSVEILEGVDENDEVIVLGQDGLADGTPVMVLEPEKTMVARTEPIGAPTGIELSPERIEQMRRRMKERGLSDEEIEQRLLQTREGGGPGVGGRPGPGPGQPDGSSGPPGQGELPPHMLEFIRNADAEQLEFIKQRMRDRGRTEQEIQQILEQIRGTSE
jgi:membrane fusion protein (multidrug efflux system)